MRKILIIGATSAIAEAVAQRFAATGAALYLLARNEERLQSLAGDLRIRGASQVWTKPFDANDFHAHAGFITQVIEDMAGIDSVLIAYGTLTDQARAEQDSSYAITELNTNAISVISLLTLLANYFVKQRSGEIAVISSVAGDRGRQSNYVYGAAKGALSIFLQGLRNRLHQHGVQVLTVKPGFVDTPMTASFPKGALWATAEKVADDIVRALNKRHDILYTPGFWRLIMLVIRSIPEAIFKRLSL